MARWRRRRDANCKQKNANRNGAATSGRVGQALSRRLYKVFMSTDPTIGDI